AFPARHGDPAAEQVDKALRDRQPQARPFVPAAEALRLLGEVLEERGHEGRVDADARVFDDELEALARAPDAQGDAAFVGEADGVGEEVVQDAVDGARVGLDHAAVAHEVELEVALARAPPRTSPAATAQRTGRRAGGAPGAPGPRAGPGRGSRSA